MHLFCPRFRSELAQRINALFRANGQCFETLQKPGAELAGAADLKPPQSSSSTQAPKQGDELAYSVPRFDACDKSLQSNCERDIYDGECSAVPPMPEMLDRRLP